MAYTFDTALENEYITVIHRDDDVGSYEFRVGQLETIVSLELGRFINGNGTKFTLSHSMRTPKQSDPYRPSRNWEDDAPYALYKAIASLTVFYLDAVKAGHTPEETWLVKN